MECSNGFCMFLCRSRWSIHIEVLWNLRIGDHEEACANVYIYMYISMTIYLLHMYNMCIYTRVVLDHTQVDKTVNEDMWKSHIPTWKSFWSDKMSKTWTLWCFVDTNDEEGPNCQWSAWCNGTRISVVEFSFMIDLKWVGRYFHCVLCKYCIYIYIQYIYIYTYYTVCIQIILNYTVCIWCYKNTFTFQNADTWHFSGRSGDVPYSGRPIALWESWCYQKMIPQIAIAGNCLKGKSNWKVWFAKQTHLELDGARPNGFNTFFGRHHKKGRLFYLDKHNKNWSTLLFQFIFGGFTVKLAKGLNIKQTLIYYRFGT